MNNSPYHQGELEIQNLTGERERAEINGAVIKEEILGGALSFIERQPLVVVGTQAPDGNLWASVLFGKPGFMHANSPKAVSLALSQTHAIKGDPILNNLKNEASIGTLMIELDTRRRLKINGRVKQITDDELVILVEESFPLCPKYIQRRKVRLSENGALPEDDVQVVSGKALGDNEVALIGACDTMFTTSAYPKGKLDVSHRGGKPGFVRVMSERQLRVPDYAGNSMFNSFGNWQFNSRAGLIFLDFAARQTLQLSGDAKVLLEQDDPENETGGTKRFWVFDIEAWQRSALPAYEFEFFDYSPFNPGGTNSQLKGL